MKLLVFCLVPFAIAQCAGIRQPQSAQKTPASTPALTWRGSVVPPEDVLIRLERSECYGSCPAYVVTLQGDGTVRFVGRNFVKSTGERTASVPRSDVQYLLDRFTDLDFFALEDSYRIACTDLPTDTLVLRVGPIRKSVENYSMGARADPWGHEYDGWKAELELKALAEAIDSVLGLDRWIELDESIESPSTDSDAVPLRIPDEKLAAVRIELDSAGDESQSPEYHIVVGGDGGVVWTGRKYVRELGDRTAAVPVENVRRILRRMDRMRFLEMKPMDFSGTETCCSASVHLKLPGLEKTVDGARLIGRQTESPPQEMTRRSVELAALVRAIRVAVRADRWIGGWDEGHPQEPIEDR